MKVVVEDANVLLDLVNGGLLGLWLGLDFENCTTHLVWHELSDETQRQQVQPFIDSGLLTIHDITPTSWNEISKFAERSRVSIADASVWFLAKSEKSILLTGDSKLRKSAKRSGVEVRGLLWVIDELSDQGKLQPHAAVEALTKMLNAGAFLPIEECQLRIAKWTVQ